MYSESWNDLEKICPLENGTWNKERLYEYLVKSCYRNYKDWLDNFFAQYKYDEALAELLFSFLLDEDFDGSESQIDAAYYIGKLDKKLLRKKKDLLLLAQKMKSSGNGHFKMINIWNGYNLQFIE